MATNYTTLLGFALPTTGELSGTWGDTVNNSITELVEDAIAATATAAVTSGDWTLTTTGTGQVNQARCAILIPTGTPGTTRNINAPNASKAYIVINQSNGAVVVRGVTGPTTGVTIAAGARALVAWNGSDFTSVSDFPINISSGSTDITGTLAVANGGTGVTSSTGSGSVVLSTSPSLTTPALGTPASGNLANCTFPTLNQNTTGTAANVTGTVAVLNGGTGATSAPTARSNLGAAASGANTDITALDQDVTVTASGTIAANSIGHRGVPVNSQTAAYNPALDDAGKLISITTGGVAILAEGTRNFPVGTAISIYNNSTSNQTISITTDTLRLAGTATTGSRTLAQYGLATIVKVATGAGVWVISGVGVT